MSRRPPASSRINAHPPIVDDLATAAEGRFVIAAKVAGRVGVDVERPVARISIQEDGLKYWGWPIAWWWDVGAGSTSPTHGHWVEGLLGRRGCGELLSSRMMRRDVRRGVAAEGVTWLEVMGGGGVVCLLVQMLGVRGVLMDVICSPVVDIKVGLVTVRVGAATEELVINALHGRLIRARGKHVLWVGITLRHVPSEKRRMERAGRKRRRTRVESVLSQEGIHLTWSTLITNAGKTGTPSLARGKQTDILQYSVRAFRSACLASIELEPRNMMSRAERKYGAHSYA